MKNKITKKLFLIIFVQSAILLYSFCGVFQKLAGQYDTFSAKFILFYIISIVILGVYAILWQIILKKLPLSTAYSNRAISTIWSVVWGVLIFSEKISWNHIVGAVIICVGVYLVNSMEKQNE